MWLNEKFYVSIDEGDKMEDRQKKVQKVIAERKKKVENQK